MLAAMTAAPLRGFVFLNDLRQCADDFV